jgi:hypothetical protein
MTGIDVPIDPAAQVPQDPLAIERKRQAEFARENRIPWDRTAEESRRLIEAFGGSEATAMRHHFLKHSTIHPDDYSDIERELVATADTARDKMLADLSEEAASDSPFAVPYEMWLRGSNFAAQTTSDIVTGAMNIAGYETERWDVRHELETFGLVALGGMDQDQASAKSYRQQAALHMALTADERNPDLPSRAGERVLYKGSELAGMLFGTFGGGVVAAPARAVMGAGAKVATHTVGKLTSVAAAKLVQNKTARKYLTAGGNMLAQSVGWGTLRAISDSQAESGQQRDIPDRLVHGAYEAVLFPIYGAMAAVGSRAVRGIAGGALTNMQKRQAQQAMTAWSKRIGLKDVPLGKREALPYIEKAWLSAGMPGMSKVTLKEAISNPRFWAEIAGYSAAAVAAEPIGLMVLDAEQRKPLWDWVLGEGDVSKVAENYFANLLAIAAFRAGGIGEVIKNERATRSFEPPKAKAEQTPEAERRAKEAQQRKDAEVQEADPQMALIKRDVREEAEQGARRKAEEEAFEENPWLHLEREQRDAIIAQRTLREGVETSPGGNRTFIGENFFDKSSVEYRIHEGKVQERDFNSNKVWRPSERTFEEIVDKIDDAQREAVEQIVKMVSQLQVDQPLAKTFMEALTTLAAVGRSRNSNVDAALRLHEEGVLHAALAQARTPEAAKQVLGHWMEVLGGLRDTVNGTQAMQLATEARAQASTATPAELEAQAMAAGREAHAAADWLKEHPGDPRVKADLEAAEAEVRGVEFAERGDKGETADAWQDYSAELRRWIAGGMEGTKPTKPGETRKKPDAKPSRAAAAKPKAPRTPGDEASLKGRSAPWLRERAKGLGVKGVSKLNKAELVRAVAEAERAKGVDTPEAPNWVEVKEGEWRFTDESGGSFTIERTASGKNFRVLLHGKRMGQWRSLKRAKAEAESLVGQSGRIEGGALTALALGGLAGVTFGLPAGVIVAVAATSFRRGGVLDRFFVKEQITRMKESGPVGVEIHDKGFATNAETNRLVGELQEPLYEFQKKTSNNPIYTTAEQRKATAYLDSTMVGNVRNGKFTEDPEGSIFSRNQLLMEGWLSPDALEGKVARELWADQEAILSKANDWVVDSPIEHTLPSGEKVDYSSKGARFQRKYTPTALDIFSSENSGLYQAVVAEIAKASELTHPEAVTLVKEILTDRMAMHGLDGREVARKIPVIPSAIRFEGQVYELLETRPHKYVEVIVEGTAARVAYVKSFGQDQAAELDLQRRLAQEGGRADAFVNLTRSLHGMPIDKPIVAPGDPGYRIGRLWKAMTQVVRGGRLSAAFIPNVPEFVSGVAPYTGLGRALRAWKDVFSEYGDLAKKVGPLKAMHAMRSRYAETGAFRRDAPQYLGGHDKLEKVSNLAAGLARMLSGQTRMANQMNDLHAAKAAELWVEDMQRVDPVTGEKGLTPHDLGLARQALDVMGFESEVVGRMLSGEASQAEYADVVRRMPAFTQGSGSKAEHSELLNRRWFNNLFPFQSYARNKLQQHSLTLGRMVEAYKTKKAAEGKPGEAAATGEFYSAVELYGRFLAGGMASGTLALSARAFVYLGLAGLFGLFDRWQDDPIGAIREVNQQWIAGGLLNSIIESADPASSRTFGESLTRAIEPFSIGSDIMSAYGATDSYRDLGPLDRAKKLFMREVPFSRIIANHAMRDVTMEASLDHYYKWRAKYAPLGRGSAGKDPTGVSEEFRVHMRKASSALRRGDREGMKVALRKALRLKGGQSVAQSLLGKRIMSGPSWSVLDPASRQHLQDYMGPEFMGELQQYDAILEAFADAVR